MKMLALPLYSVKVTECCINNFSKLRNDFVSNALYNADTLSSVDMQVLILVYRSFLYTLCLL